MSKATKRKHVTKEIMEKYYEPEDDERIVKIVGGRGNNLHEVEADDGACFLVSMPTKFRRNVWVKRGDFVVMSPIKEGVKVQGEIVYILYPKQIKHLKDEGKWPKCFDGDTAPIDNKKSPHNDNSNSEEITRFSTNDYGESEDDDDDSDLFENPNHRPIVCYDEETDSTSEEEEEEETGEEESGNKNSDVMPDLNNEQEREDQTEIPTEKFQNLGI